MKWYHEIIKKQEKIGRFDKKTYIFNLKQQILFFAANNQ